MKDIIAKLTAIEGKKQLNESSIQGNQEQHDDGDINQLDWYRDLKSKTQKSRWEEDTRGLDQPPAPIGEAGGISELSKVYPDSRAGVVEYMQYGYDKRFLKKLDLPTCKIHADPSVEGVWAVDSMASGFRCIIYLAGYKDPWGKIRDHNDNEEGGFTMSYMKKLVERDTLNPRLMNQWAKCGSLDPDDMAKLMEYYSQNYGIDEASLSGPTQKYNEPDEDYNDGDPESDNYCDNCGENFPMSYDSCPNCTEVDEGIVDTVKGAYRKYKRGAEASDKGWSKFGDILRAGNDEVEGRKAVRNANRYYNLTNKQKGSHTAGGFPRTSVPGRPSVDEAADDWKDSAGAVAGAITHRITRQRLDLLRQYGPEAVMNAIDEVAEFVGDVEEIGSSDVSAWVKSVERALASFAKTGGMVEGDSGWDEEDEPGWLTHPEDERDPDTMRGGHDDLATRDIDEANTIIEPHSMGMPSVADNKKWKVTWWVEEKSYGIAPGREYEECDIVTAPTADEAFRIVKSRPKQTGRMRYGFNVVPAQEKDLEEGAKVDRMVGHIKKSEKKLGKSSKDAENIAWATANKRGMLDNKNKKTEGKNMTKNTIKESVDFGNASPELIKILRHFGKEVADFQQGGELHDNLYDALYDYYFDDMPYGTKKARTGDPYEWIADRLDRDMGTSKSIEGFGTTYFPGDDVEEGAAGDIMPLEAVGDIHPAEQSLYQDAIGDVEDPDGFNYNSRGEWVGSSGEYDAGGHYNAEKHAGRAEWERDLTDESGTLNTPGSIAGSVSPVPEPGEEVITELNAPDEAKITDMLSNIGLDHGLDFWFEGDEIVVIGRKEAKLVTTTVGGHIQSVDGEEYRISAKPRAPKAEPTDINDLAAVPELGESAEAEVTEELTEELTEEVSADDVELLTMQYKSGQLSYDQFREKLDSLEHTDYSMRQGEMGNPDRQYQMSRDDEDDDFGNSLDGDEFGDIDDNDHDYANALDDEQLEGEFANSAEEPAQPEVHTSTTAMINQGDDLNRPKKQSWPIRNKGDNPMAETRSLMKQYNAMKASISLK